MNYDRTKEKDFTKEFDFFLDKLKNDEPFAFTRFSDGECFILQNQRLVLAEHHYQTGGKAGYNIYGPEELKQFDPSKHQFYRQELIKSLEHSQPGYYKGIPSQQDIHIRLNTEINNMEEWTFANLFINANYKRFIEEIVTPILPAKNIIYVVNARANFDNCPFKPMKTLLVGENCFINDYSAIEDLKKFLDNAGDMRYVVLCSAASLSNLIIWECFRDYPQHTYLDVGSSINPYLGDKMQSCFHTRDYLRAYWRGERNYYGNQEDVWHYNS